MKGGLPKLSDEQRAEIVRRGREGEFMSILAKEFGISSDYVSKLVNRSKA